MTWLWVIKKKCRNQGRENHSSFLVSTRWCVMAVFLRDMTQCCGENQTGVWWDAGCRQFIYYRKPSISVMCSEWVWTNALTQPQRCSPAAGEVCWVSIPTWEYYIQWVVSGGFQGGNFDSNLSLHFPTVPGAQQLFRRLHYSLLQFLWARIKKQRLQRQFSEAEWSFPWELGCRSPNWM